MGFRLYSGWASGLTGRPHLASDLRNRTNRVSSRLLRGLSQPAGRFFAARTRPSRRVKRGALYVWTHRRVQNSQPLGPAGQARFGVPRAMGESRSKAKTSKGRAAPVPHFGPEAGFRAADGAGSMGLRGIGCFSEGRGPRRVARSRDEK